MKFETKRENPFFLRHVEQCESRATAWTSAPSSDGAWRAHARTRARLKPADELEYTPEGFSSTSLALPFSPGRFRVPQMCHQTLVSI